jgi:hypothetical protein
MLAWLTTKLLDLETRGLSLIGKPSPARVKGIGNHEGATATKRAKFIDDAAERVESKHDASGQGVYSNPLMLSPERL